MFSMFVCRCLSLPIVGSEFGCLGLEAQAFAKRGIANILSQMLRGSPLRSAN